MGRWTSMRQLFWCSLVMDVETLNPDPLPPADTTSNVPTSGRRGLEFARSADHRKSWVQSISFTVNSFFYVFSLLQSADLVDSPPFLRHSETWCLSDVILQSSSLIGSTQECPKRLKVKAYLNSSKNVVNLFGVFYTTNSSDCAWTCLWARCDSEKNAWLAICRIDRYDFQSQKWQGNSTCCCCCCCCSCCLLNQCIHGCLGCVTIALLGSDFLCTEQRRYCMLPTTIAGNLHWLSYVQVCPHCLSVNKSEWCSGAGICSYQQFIKPD